MMPESTTTVTSRAVRWTGPATDAVREDDHWATPVGS